MLGTNRQSRILIVVVGCALGFIGCRTAPATMPSGTTDYLLPDQSAYVTVTVEGNRDLMSHVVGQFVDNADVVINRIDSFAGNVLLSPERAELSGVAFGRFPVGATRFALWRDRGFDRAVARTDSGRLVYFRQGSGLVEVAVPDSGVLVLSTDSVEAYLAAVRTGGGLDDDGAITAQRDLLIVVPDPGRLLEDRLALSLPGFPVEAMTIFADAAESSAATDGASESLATPGRLAPSDESTATSVPGLELGGTFTFSGDGQAVLFSRLGRGFILALMRSLGLETAGLRESVVLSVEGSTLTFSGIPVSADDLTGILSNLLGASS